MTGPVLNVAVKVPGPVLVTVQYEDGGVEGAWSRIDVPLLKFTPAPHWDARYHDGTIASGEPVQLLFWGSFWNTPEGADRLNLVADRIQRLIGSPYFSALDQYGVRPPTYRGALVVTEPEPPSSFADGRMDEVLDLVDALIDSGTYPEPDDGRIASVVFMPKDFHPPANPGAHASDYDVDLPFDSHRFWAAWVRYCDPSFTDADPLAHDPENMCMVAAHELVEMFTDPDGGGWWMGNDQHEGELCDLAFTGSVPNQAFVNGALVQAYWSNRDQADVIPTAGPYRARISGTVREKSRYEVARGTFRPTLSPSACHRAAECCIEDRDYTWIVTGFDEVAELTLDYEGVHSPRTSWYVNGQPAEFGAGTIDWEFDGVEYNGLDPTPARKMLSIDYVNTATSLRLTTDNPQLAFDVQVEAVVTDTSIKGELQPPEIKLSPAVTVGFRGESANAESDYADRYGACIKALARLMTPKKLPVGTGPPHGGHGPTRDPVTGLPAHLGVIGRVRLAAALDLLRGADDLLPGHGDELREAVYANTPELKIAFGSKRPF